MGAATTQFVWRNNNCFPLHTKGNFFQLTMRQHTIGQQKLTSANLKKGTKNKWKSQQILNKISKLIVKSNMTSVA